MSRAVLRFHPDGAIAVCPCGYESKPASIPGASNAARLHVCRKTVALGAEKRNGSSQPPRKRLTPSEGLPLPDPLTGVEGRENASLGFDAGSCVECGRGFSEDHPSDYLGRKCAEGCSTSPRDRWKAARKPVCEACGKRRSVHQHHALREQVISRAGGDPLDPRWSISLCFEDHMGTAHGDALGSRLDISVVPDPAVMAAFELLGPAAFDEFARTYGGDVEGRLGWMVAA